ncbi:SigmaW regulon antibacterial [Stieleria maiorica]|uniref:SigmaW regulon antibacterial n=1 Tax=Stieleria maiorica TaxID=2795974 RepID=A0A5B9MPM3_9BACT|nr:SigmaW regulon antibacterial [Stieleria maiorica]
MDKFAAGLLVGCVMTFIAMRLLEFLRILWPWQRAMMSGAQVSLVSILRMRLKGCPVPFLVDAHSALVHSGDKIEMDQVEACYLAHKHEVNEDDMGEFLTMVRDFKRRGSGNV